MLATGNYFPVLATMKIKIDQVPAIANPEHGDRIQIIPVKARMPQKVTTSKEVAHFYLKRHTKLEKAERPARIEIGMIMQLDFETKSHPPDPTGQAGQSRFTYPSCAQAGPVQ